ncbi:hypothetical protein KR222_001199 [Zaprionus bogoriensis]|nr:hypothetical protein KR222_001199 [Zaprionus bogoriensis]
MWTPNVPNWYRYSTLSSQQHTERTDYQPLAQIHSLTPGYYGQLSQLQQQPQLEQQFYYSQTQPQPSTQNYWMNYAAQQPQFYHNAWYGMSQSPENPYTMGQQSSPGGSITASQERYFRRPAGNQANTTFVPQLASGSLSRIDSSTSFRDNRGTRIRSSEHDIIEYNRIAARKLSEKTNRESTFSTQRVESNKDNAVSKKSVEKKLGQAITNKQEHNRNNNRNNNTPTESHVKQTKNSEKFQESPKSCRKLEKYVENLIQSCLEGKHTDKPSNKAEEVLSDSSSIDNSIDNSLDRPSDNQSGNLKAGGSFIKKLRFFKKAKRSDTATNDSPSCSSQSSTSTLKNKSFFKLGFLGRLFGSIESSKNDLTLPRGKEVKRPCKQASKAKGMRQDN